MKIAVTGAAGFLGSWLTEKLVGMGHSVVGVDNMVGGSHDNLSGIPVLFRHADCGDLDHVTAVLGGCEVVYHCAALAHEGLSVFSPVTIVDNVVMGTVATATAAIRNGVKRFVNCSSMARYGNQDAPFYEKMLPRPVDPYGVAKVCAEQQLNVLGRLHGMQVVHAVPHNIIGPRQKYDDPYRNVASIMINRMLQGQQPIIYGDGRQRRCFSFVQDVIDVMVQLMDCEIQSGEPEVYNVGPDSQDGEVVSVNDLAHRIGKIIGMEVRPIYHPDRPGEVKLAHCSSGRIRKRFGFQARTSLDEGLRLMVEDVKKRGTRPFVYHLPIEIERGAPKTWKEKLV